MYKIFVRYIMSRMSLRLSSFSQLSFIQYMRPFGSFTCLFFVLFFSLPISILIIVTLSVLHIIAHKSELWIISHCSGSAMCLVMVLYLTQWRKDPGIRIHGVDIFLTKHSAQHTIHHNTTQRVRPSSCITTQHNIPRQPCATQIGLNSAN